MTGPHLVGGTDVRGERSESAGREAPLTAATETKHSKPGEAEHPTTTERTPVPTEDERKLIMSAVPVSLTPKWYTVAQVARLLGYGESKVRMLIISGDLRSLKDGRSRRVLPEWVDEYVALRASQADGRWAP